MSGVYVRLTCGGPAHAPGMDLGAFVLSWFPGHVSMGILGCCAVGSAVLSQADETDAPGFLGVQGSGI